MEQLSKHPTPVVYVVYPGHEPQVLWQPDPGRKPWWRREWFVIPASLVVGIVIGSLRSPQAPTVVAQVSARPWTAAGAPATVPSPRPVTAVAGRAVRVPSPQPGTPVSRAVSASVAVASAAKRATPTIPGTTVPGTGVYLVGVDIPPGTYWTAGSDGCYWARLSDTSGDPAAVIANDITTEPTTVTIKATDGVFETRGCGAWTLRR